MATGNTTAKLATHAADGAVALELRRRDAFRAVFGAGAAVLVGLDSTPADAQAAVVPQFLHGVASGDPRRDRVILWTRVTPPGGGRVQVEWRVSTSSDMATVVAQGVAATNSSRDYTVKVDAGGLQPGTLYWFQFAAGGVTSPVGRTRTLPAAGSLDPVNFAIFSCSNYVKGFFNAYGEAARDPALTAVLHLGDYTYEYGRNGYQTPALALGLVTEPRAAALVPPTETVLLDAYRQRLALYRTDPQLQALHAHAPWVAIYDDHESANDAWTDGAENHTPATEGSWQARKEAALKAYYEWMPVREAANARYDANGNPNGLYRSFSFGRLAQLIAVDTRLAGRDRQLSAAQLVGLYATANVTGNFNGDQVNGRPRTLLGAAQEAWLDERLSARGTIWQVLANQVLVHYQIAPDFLGSPLLTDPQKQQIVATIDRIFGPGSGAQFGAIGAQGLPNPETVDSWNGYPTARQRLNASLAKATNPIVVSGDSHNFWAANLAGAGAAGPRTPLAVEFGTASVSAPGFEEIFPGLPPALLSAIITQSSANKSPNDRITYAETSKRGFIKLALTETRAIADYVQLSTVFSTSYTTTTQRFEVAAGAKKIAGT